MHELQDLVFRFAIEHGDAERWHVVNPDGSSLSNWIVPRIVKDDDAPAMRAYLEAALEKPCVHGERTPVVCCQAADFVGRDHPIRNRCEESGTEVCAREDCELHLAHHAAHHPDDAGTA